MESSKILKVRPSLSSHLFPITNGGIVEDAQLGQAIDQFRKRLAVLERDNEVSGERVRDLEGRLYADQVESESSVSSEHEEDPHRQAGEEGRSSARESCIFVPSEVTDTRESM